MIEMVCFDIDGVLTDGTVHIDQYGNESKAVKLTEMDALNDIKRLGCKLAAITGENTAVVELFKRRTEWDWFCAGCKDKLSELKKIEDQYGLTKEQICYIGDGKYDIPAIEYAGLGVCPGNAIREARDAADIVLSGAGGQSCIHELYLLLRDMKGQGERRMANNDAAWLLEGAMSGHVKMCRDIAADEEIKQSIEKAAELILCSIRNNGAVYLCGNGGSAADSQHIATEFVSRFYKERRALNAEALTVNTSSLTAIGNDYDFDRVFARQLEAKGRPGDTLIGITTSGTSKNVAKAMEYAAANGIHTVLLTGNRDNSYDPTIYECVVRMPSDDTPRVQEGHIFVGHVMAEYVESMIVKEERGKE